MLRARLTLLAALAAAGCGAPATDLAVRFDGIGPHARPIHTTSAEAQRWFDQGLAFAYAFNHDEAVRSFTEVTRLDPQSPMGWWGIAYALGPHINNSAMPPERERKAWEAAQAAVSRRDHGDPTEQALVAAVAQRYSDAPAPDRAALDQSYADAMRLAWAAHSDDADVGALCAEALMDLHPWDLWTSEGAPKDWTPEIVDVLEAALRRDPMHPGALHFYIHAVEASSDPGRAQAVADRLRPLVPVSGHMLHMPSHIDVLLGHWDEAIASNERAIAADHAYRARRPQQDFQYMYMGHNLAMLTFAAMMDGRSEQAVQTARRIMPDVPEDFARSNPQVVEGNFSIVYDALLRFGRWEEMLDQPAPPEWLTIMTALWHQSRGVALAALGRVPEARQEQAAFREAVARVPQDRALAINPVHRIFDVADRVLAGEIAYREGDIDEAVEQLSHAIELEDQLAYMEPPEWPQPVRHTLGAILLQAGRVDEAERLYREDLANWPDNGWSLHGLADCLKRRDADPAEVAAVTEDYKKAWAQADIEIGSSCLCVRAK